MFVARRDWVCAVSTAPSSTRIREARTRILNPLILLAFVTIVLPCENAEQSCGEERDGPRDPRTGFRAHHQSPVRVPAVPQRARRCGGADGFVAGVGGAIPPQRGADPEGSCLLRRVRRARG